jgi:uridine kinase
VSLLEAGSRRAMTQCKIIGVAGGTASGKTTLARDLHRIGGADRVQVIPLDSYYRCHSHLPLEERAKINYDLPDSFEADLLRAHLDLLLSGQAVDIPVYDFATHTRSLVESHRIVAAPIIIVEGILSLHFTQLREVYSYSVFVEAPDQLRFERRLKRDVAERGRTEASVRAQWNETVQPMHLRFCQPSSEHASEVVSGAAWDDAVISSLWDRILAATAHYAEPMLVG